MDKDKYTLVFVDSESDGIVCAYCPEETYIRIGFQVELDSKVEGTVIYTDSYNTLPKIKEFEGTLRGKKVHKIMCAYERKAVKW